MTSLVAVTITSPWACQPREGLSYNGLTWRDVSPRPQTAPSPSLRSIVHQRFSLNPLDLSDSLLGQAY